jgi:hypothetical protein
MWYCGFRYNVESYVDPIFGRNMLPPLFGEKVLGRSLTSDALCPNMKAAWTSKISIYWYLHTRLQGVKAQYNPQCQNPKIYI